MPTTSRSDPFRDEREHERVGVSDEPEDVDDAGADLDEDETNGQPDYYARLGVPASATPEELRRAYLRLVKLWHPDRYNNAPESLRARAERRMRQLNEAYDALSGPQERSAYDAQREGRGEPIGDVINVFGQRGAAPLSAYDEGMDGHASANPNGAGQFFGALAMILALGLLGGVIGGGGFGGGVGALVVLLGIVALVVAASFFVAESPLAKWANQTMEAEPRKYAGAERRRERPAPAQHAASSSNPSDAAATRAATFDALIDEALAAVPHAFDEYMRNVVVRAEEEPDEETLRRAGVPEGHTLLGLYHGVSLTKRGAGEASPEVITIYRGPIERYCGRDLERIRRQVRATVLHELAHHFGIDHDDMPEWVK